jgi:S1-C subfamily serine protease
MSARLLALAAGLLAALVLAACGDDADDPSMTTTTTVSEETEDGEQQPQPARAVAGDLDPHAVYEAAAPGVVTVRSVFGGGGEADILGGGAQAGQGSGFVVSDDGEIVTNAHVVTDADQAGVPTGPINEAKEVFVEFSDLNQVEAEIVGVDPFADVALLKIDPEGLDLHPLPLGSENDVEVGEGVAAIGSPFSQDQSLSVGIVSASDRSIPGLTQFRIEGAIQTDASINPGNSGGPLIDAAGEVVGINQQINTTSGGNEGVGFAVPIDLAERSVEQLREDGEAEYAYLGVETRELYPQLAEELDVDVDTGALVVDVVNGGPAEEAGLKEGTEPFRFQGFGYRAGGDIITGVDGQEVRTAGDLPRVVALLDPGQEITLDVIRDGEPTQVDVTLGERPSS